MDCTVFYESWQMECCGKPFCPGDRVKWLVCTAEGLNTPVDTGKVDYCYEAHSRAWQNLFVLVGKVDAIYILYEKYQPSADNPRLLLPVSGQMIKTAAAKGFDKKFEDMEAAGYLVKLKDCTVRPAEQSEVTFR